VIVVCRWIKSFQQRQCTLRAQGSTKQEASMKLRWGITRKVGKVHINAGFSLKRFALGFTVCKEYIDLEVAFFWIGVEF
jgi:hypothetical protein